MSERATTRLIPTPCWMRAAWRACDAHACIRLWGRRASLAGLIWGACHTPHCVHVPTSHTRMRFSSAAAALQLALAQHAFGAFTGAASIHIHIRTRCVPLPKPPSLSLCACCQAARVAHRSVGAGALPQVAAPGRRLGGAAAAASAAGEGAGRGGGGGGGGAPHSWATPMHPVACARHVAQRHAPPPLVMIEAHGHRGTWHLHNREGGAAQHSSEPGLFRHVQGTVLGDGNGSV